MDCLSHHGRYRSFNRSAFQVTQDAASRAAVPTVLVVDVGGGARMFVAAPNSMNEGSLEWRLRHGDAVAMRFQAASVVSSTSYLVSGEISMKEATRRLRIMRKSYKDARAALEGAP